MISLLLIDSIIRNWIFASILRGGGSFFSGMPNLEPAIVIPAKAGIQKNW
jgi:hypothetical protein